MIAALAEKHRFFHWHLAFPDVFADHGRKTMDDAAVVVGGPSSVVGFDVILGNPPWERIKLQEKEYFADKAPEIANARTKAKRHKLIKRLPETDPALLAAYVDAMHGSEALSTYLRESGRYPLSAVGDINTYQVFAGLVRRLINTNGRVGIVVPTGIATAFSTKDYFATLIENEELVSLYSFENREGIFPGVHRNYEFCLLTLTGPGQGPEEIEFSFFLYRADDLQDDERRFRLTKQDLNRINPNTKTCPVFRTKQDAELTRKLYGRISVLVNEAKKHDQWGVSFKQGLFNMASDSDLFHMRAELETSGFGLKDNRFIRDDLAYLPLYEAKMMHQFEHRHGTYEGQTVEQIKKGYCRDLTTEEHRDPGHFVLPRYWVLSDDVKEHAPGYIEDFDWLIGFRDVTRAVDKRTAQFAVLPFVGIGHKIPLIFLTNATSIQICAFLGNINSFTLDYVVRQKMGGISLSYFILEQLPVLPPDHYTPDLLRFIVPRVLELTYTAWDLQPFAADIWAEALATDRALAKALLEQWEANREATQAYPREAPFSEPGWPRPPFTWDEARRSQLRAELDALYAHLYGLSREELAYIMETFPIVKRKDEAKYGEYQTKRLVLEAYERLRFLK